MGSCIDNTVSRIVVRQVVAGISGIALVKSEFDNFHVGIAALFYKLFNAIGHVAKILCDDLSVSQSC